MGNASPTSGTPMELRNSKLFPSRAVRSQVFRPAPVRITTEFAVVLGAIPGRNAARAVAGDFRLGTVGIQQADAEVGVVGGQHPFHAIGADAVVAVADAPAEGMDVAGRVGEINDQKIVAAGGGFDEGNVLSRARRLCASATDGRIVTNGEEAGMLTSKCMQRWPGVTVTAES